MRNIQRDDELLARLKAGDEQALHDLTDAYGSKVYQLAFRHLRNRQDAEEVTQDVLFKVYRKVGEFRGDAALSSWIYRITFNAAMSRLRSIRFQPPLSDDGRFVGSDGEHGADRQRETPDRSELADERLFRSQLRHRVFRALLALPAIYRAPVMMRNVQRR